MWSPGPLELILILGVVLLLFGSKKIRSLGTDLGSAIKGFRKSVTDADKPPEPKPVEADKPSSSES